MAKADPEQRKRFEEAAREIGADESGETFERAFSKIVPPKHATAEPKPRPKVKKRRNG